MIVQNKIAITSTAMAVLIGTFAMNSNPAAAQDQEQTAAALEKYEATINATLRTARDEEKEFISDIFELVAAGTLPKNIVDRSFLWVRKNRMHSSYRFIYFERVLRIHADKLRITIPAFDYSIYNANGGG